MVEKLVLKSSPEWLPENSGAKELERVADGLVKSLEGDWDIRELSPEEQKKLREKIFTVGKILLTCGALGIGMAEMEAAKIVTEGGASINAIYASLAPLLKAIPSLLVFLYGAGKIRQSQDSRPHFTDGAHNK